MIHAADSSLSEIQKQTCTGAAIAAAGFDKDVLGELYKDAYTASLHYALDPSNCPLMIYHYTHPKPAVLSQRDAARNRMNCCVQNTSERGTGIDGRPRKTGQLPFITLLLL